MGRRFGGRLGGIREEGRKEGWVGERNGAGMWACGRNRRHRVKLFVIYEFLHQNIIIE